MNWNTGYTAMYSLQRVDPISWQDVGPYDLISGGISKSTSKLVESADFTMSETPGECWLRCYLRAKQGEDGARVALFTGLASAPQRSLAGNNVTYKVECYSVLKPIDDILVPRGFFIASGAQGERVAAELLQHGPAPVTYDTPSPTLTEPIIAEDSDTYLSIALKILDVIGWRIRISGRGEIDIIPKPDEESARFDEHENDCIEVNITDTNNWFSAPNCIRAAMKDSYVEVKDTDPASDLSTVSRQANRGGSGEIWTQMSVSSLGEGDTLRMYAERKLKELQSPARKISYTRRFHPDVTVSDKVRLHLPGHGIDDVFTVTSQRITLGYSARVAEEVNA